MNMNTEGPMSEALQAAKTSAEAALMMIEAALMAGTVTQERVGEIENSLRAATEAMGAMKWADPDDPVFQAAVAEAMKEAGMTRENRPR